MNEFKPYLFPELLNDLKGLSFTTGIFPSQKINMLVEDKKIWADGGVEEAQIQPSSIDLRLGPVAWRVQASFLPGKNSTVEAKAKDLIMTEIDLTRPTVFEKDCIY
ncbi:MAG: 2'-deoxycytidine 5'-triphosphate deaminase, partial [Actinobacteria bacterium]|nr:2'-deoxycytidine 5'-triphosphate deaminase [Actinomycetota bacterium]